MRQYLTICSRNASPFRCDEPKGVQLEYIRDLLRFRELFYFFALRDLIVRYRQAFFGIAWAVFDLS